MTTDVADLRNRTNNPLERQNRELNSLFPTPHPNLLVFVETIKTDSTNNVAKIDQIKRNARKAPKHKGIQWDQALIINQLTLHQVHWQIFYVV